MPNDPITTKFRADISELKQNITEANRLIKLANSEFKAASSGMDDWASTADGLSAKLDQLNAVHDAEQKKLESLQKQYQLTAEHYGENSEQAQNLAIKLNNQQAAVNKVNKEIEKYTEQLDAINAAAQNSSDSTEDQRTAYERLQDTISQNEKLLQDLKTQYASVALEQGDSSDAAKDLAGQIDSLSSELKQNKSDLKNAEAAADSFDRTLDDLGDSAKEADGGFTILKGAIAEFSGNVLTAAANKITSFVGSLFDLAEATEEYRSMMAKVEGSANSFGYSVEFANEKYQEFYKYIGDDQMATNAITNLMGMRVATETVSDVAEAAISVWSAYGDSIPIEGLTESINESAQVAKVTGSLADTINWAARSQQSWSAAMEGHDAAQQAFNKSVKEGEAVEDAFSAALAACSSTQERADLIAQTLNQTYGQSKATYDEMSSSILAANEAELNLKDTQAELGEAVAPVHTAITNLKSQALDALTPAITGVMWALGSVLNLIVQTPGATEVLIAVVAGLTTGLSSLAVALGIQSLIKGVTTAFGALNAVMAANPFILIATLIAGIVTALITLLSTSEDFRKAWGTIWSGAVSIVSGAAKKIGTFFMDTIPKAFDKTVNFVKNNWQTIATFLVNPFAGGFKLIYDQNENFRNAVNKLVDDIINSLDNIFPGFRDMVENIAAAIRSGDWGALGKYVVQGIANGIKAGLMLPINAIKSLATSIWNTFARALKINSPSKVMEDGGDYIDEGVAQGVTKNKGKVADAIDKLVKTIESGLEINKSKFEKMLDGITTALRNQLEKQKKLRLDAIKASLAEEETASEKRLAIYEKEYNAQLSQLDAETTAQVKAIQDQIDAIEAAEEAKKKAQEEQEYNDTVASLQSQLSTAGTDEERAEIQKQLTETIAEWNEKKRQEELEAQKAALEAQIDAIQENADKQKEILENQYDEKVSLENERLSDVQESLEKESSYWEDYYEQRLSDEAINAEARELVLSKNQDAIIDLLETYNPKWQDAGQSLADSLINGLESESKSTKDAIAESIDLTDTIRTQEAQLEKLRQKSEQIKSAASGASGAVKGVGDAAAGLSFPADDLDLYGQELTELGEEAETSSGFISGIADKASEMATKAGEAISGFAVSAGEFFTVTIPGAIDGMIQWFSGIPGKVGGFLTETWNGVSQWAIDMATSALETGQNFLQNVMQFFDDLPGEIGYAIGYALGKVAQWGIDLYTFATTEIPRFVNTVITYISQLPGQFLIWLTNTINNVIAWGVNLVNTGKQKAAEFLDQVIQFVQQLPGRAKEWLDQTITKVIEWGADLVRKGREAAEDMVDDIIDAVKGLPDEMYKVGSDLVQGIWNGITSMGDWLKGKITHFANSIIEGFKDSFDIESPSKRMRDEVGKFLPAGIGESFEKYKNLAMKPARKLADDLVGAMGTDQIKTGVSAQVRGITGRLTGAARRFGAVDQTVKNITFNQYNNSPKALSRLEIYRQSRNLLRGASINV